MTTPNTQGDSWDYQKVVDLQLHHLSFEDIAKILNDIASKERAEGERRGREDEKERILACGHAHEPVHGFQPYGYIKNEEMERHIFMDGFKDGRAMLMIDVMSKRDPRKATLPTDSKEKNGCDDPTCHVANISRHGHPTTPDSTEEITNKD